MVGGRGFLYLLGLALIGLGVFGRLPHPFNVACGLAGFALLVASAAVLLARGGGLQDPQQRTSVEGGFTGATATKRTRPSRAVTWLRSRPRATSTGSFLISSVAAGYLWAATFGDGLRGLQTTSQLDRSTSYPDANVAYIAALTVYAGGLFAALAAGLTPSRSRLAGWFAATATAGAAAFALSRLFH